MSVEELQKDELQQEIDALKNSEPYKEKFADPEVQSLQQAIDIVSKLRKNLEIGSAGYGIIRDT
jgi:hypothetical protein